MSDSDIAARRLTGYERFCRSLLIPAGDLVFGHSVASRFRELQSLQWQSRDEIHAYRQSRIRDLLTFCAERVPFYKEAFLELGLARRDLESFDTDQLPQLPILTKQHLLTRFEDLKVQGFRGSVTEMKSSGSTGLQTVTLSDKSCFTEVYATQLLFWSWGGFFMGKPHLQTGMSLERGALRTLKDNLFRCSYVSAFGLSDADLQRIVDLIKRKRIRSIFGYASSIYVIARYVEKNDFRLQMDSIFTWGDSLFPHYRELIENAFSCPVNDCYGLGEGLQCAAQCEQHDALHEAMHGVVVEIVDANGQSVPTGQLGKVVVTRFVPGAMPLLRYDTGDVAYFVDGECKCGRQLRRISRIQGRETDIVTTPAGDRLIVHFFTQIFECVPEIDQFQVRQQSPESISVRYIPRPGFEHSILDSIREQILSNCTFPLRIDFQAVEKIPLEKSNKRRFVISTVPLD